MNANLRRVLYIIGVIGGAAVTWALAKGWIDTADGAFATAILAALNGLAAVNTTSSTPVTIDQPATIIPGTTLNVPASPTIEVPHSSDTIDQPAIPGTTLDAPALDVAHSSDAKADAATYDPKHDAPEGE